MSSQYSSPRREALNEEQIRSNSQFSLNNENKDQQFVAKYIEILKKNVEGKIISLPRVLNILKFHCLLRNNQQLETLRSYFEQNFHYIGKIKDKLDNFKCLDVFRYMILEKYKAFQTIFRVGDVGRKMYFLLSGEVAIFLPKTNKSQEVQNLVCHDFKDVVSIQFHEYTLMAIKKFGQVFGEIAIEQKVTRTATVVAKTDVQVAMLSFEMFQDVIGKYQNELTSTKLEFINQLPIFQDWEKKQKLIALSSFEQCKVLAGQYIFQKGTFDEFSYLVESGEVEIIQWIQIKSNLTNKYIMKSKTMAVINSGQFFGDYEHANNLKIRITSAKAKMETIYYKVEYTALINLIDMYSNLKSFQKQQMTKFQIQQNISGKANEILQNIDLENQNNGIVTLDMENISKNYYQLKKIDQSIKNLKYKIFKTKDESYKEYYNQQIKQLDNIVSAYDKMETQKYSCQIPFKYDPFVKDQNCISSPGRKRFKLRNQNNNEELSKLQQKIENKELEKYISPRQLQRIQQKIKNNSQSTKNESIHKQCYENSISFSKILESKLNKLQLSIKASPHKKQLENTTYLSDTLSENRSINIKTFHRESKSPLLEKLSTRSSRMLIQKRRLDNYLKQ